MHCGVSGSPCPTVVGGEATCNGSACGGTCPAGKELCLGECIPAGSPCDMNCKTPGTHNCNSVCVQNTDPNTCGASCDPCKAPPGGTATCDGTTCGFTCDQGKRCGEGPTARCGACCVADDCPAQPGKTASCDAATLRCQYVCPAGQKECNGQCIPADACCKDADCPPMAASCQVGKCDSSTGCDANLACDDNHSSNPDLFRCRPCGGASQACCPRGSACDTQFVCTTIDATPPFNKFCFEPQPPG
jgi:hypothetical protein